MTLIRLFVFFYLIISIPVCSTGQGPRDIAKVKTQLLKYDTSRYRFNYVIPFKKIEVIDYRFDTSKVGYATHGNRENHTILAATGGTADFLNTRLNEYFKNNLDPSSSKTLVLILKKLWLEYGSINQMLNAKNISGESSVITLNKNSVCLSDIDVFAKSDSGYQALVRLTQVFVIDKFDRYSDFYLLLHPFDSLISKIQSMDVPTILASKRKFSIDDIHTNYQKRFDIPVLSSNNLNRGIFFSFNDFKNNRPSYPDFKYKKFELSTEVTISKDGKEVPAGDYWGFYDGKDLYIKPGFIPFKAIRQTNTFDLLGSMGGKIVPIIIPIPGGGYITTSTSYVYLYPLQVDMETGRVY